MDGHLKKTTFFSKANKEFFDVQSMILATQPRALPVTRPLIKARTCVRTPFCQPIVTPGGVGPS